jgi:CRP-like cAMP-binding protein
MNTDEKRALLKTFLRQSFTGSEEGMDEFIQCFTELTLKKKEHLTEAGKVCNQLAFVVSGLLRSYALKSNGLETTTGFYTENTLHTSCCSYLTEKESLYSVHALETCELLLIDRPHLEQQRTGIDGNALLSLFIKNELIYTQDYALTICSEEACKRYQWFITHYPTLLYRTKADHIASFLGISRETLVKIRTEKY